jgi:hypothetical protein
MKRATGRLALASAVALLSVCASRASAQPPPGMMGGAATPYGAMYANPYANPYLNPFLNPYMAQTPTSAGNAALYLFSAQQANGGIGSGRISGVRPGPSAAPAPAAAASNRRVSDTPGASAARYFSRGTPAGAGLGRYYNRQGRHYPNSGH